MGKYRSRVSLPIRPCWRHKSATKTVFDLRQQCKTRKVRQGNLRLFGRSGSRARSVGVEHGRLCNLTRPPLSQLAGFYGRSDHWTIVCNCGGCASNLLQTIPQTAPVEDPLRNAIQGDPGHNLFLEIGSPSDTSNARFTGSEQNSGWHTGLARRVVPLSETVDAARSCSRYH